MGCPYETVSEEEKKYPLHEKTPFPVGKPEYDEMKKVFEAQYQLRLNLSLKLASYIAIGLGKDRDFFKSWFECDSASCFRTINCQPRCESKVDMSNISEEHLKLTTSEHTDSDFLTILTTFGYAGL